MYLFLLLMRSTSARKTMQLLHYGAGVPGLRLFIYARVPLVRLSCLLAYGCLLCVCVCVLVYVVFPCVCRCVSSLRHIHIFVFCFSIVASGRCRVKRMHPVYGGRRIDLSFRLSFSRARSFLIILWTSQVAGDRSAETSVRHLALEFLVSIVEAAPAMCRKMGEGGGSSPSLASTTSSGSPSPNSPAGVAVGMAGVGDGVGGVGQGSFAATVIPVCFSMMTELPVSVIIG